MNHADILADRDEGTTQATDVVAGHHPALLDRIVEHGQRRRRAGRATALNAHFFENVRHAVTDHRRRCQGEVDDAKRCIEPLARFQRDQLADAGDLEGHALDRFGHDVELLATHFFQRGLDHARAADANVDGFLRFADAMKRPSHEGIVLDGIGKDDEFGATQTIPVCRQLSRLLDNLPHFTDGIHVDAFLGGADIDRGADALRHGQRLGNRTDQDAVALAVAFLHQRGKAADEIHPERTGGLVERTRESHVIVVVRRASHQRHRRDGDSFVDDRNAEFEFELIADRDQIFGIAADFLVDPAPRFFSVRIAAVEQRNPHGDGADIQLLLIDHLDRFKNIKGIHGSDPVHRVENILALHADGNTEPLAQTIQPRLEFVDADRHASKIDEHDHGEKLAHDRLVDIENIDLVSAEFRADSSDDSFFVFSDNGNNGAHLG